MAVLVHDVIFIVCYRPPGPDVKDFVTHLNDVFRSVQLTYDKICILGDFNFPDLKWDESNYNHINDYNTLFLDFIEHFGLVQLNSVVSNKFNHILDLIICNFPEQFSQISKHEAEFNTDHVILYFSIKTRLSYAHKESQKSVYNYKLANFHELQDALDVVDFDKIITESADIHSAWSNWLNTVNNLVERHVPKVRIRDKEFPEWFDKEVLHLRKIKNTAWRRARKKNTPTAWAKFKKLRNTGTNSDRILYR